MRAAVSGREMKKIDRRSIEDYGIPSMVLMERAAMAVAAEAEAILRRGAAKTPASDAVSWPSQVWRETAPAPGVAPSWAEKPPAPGAKTSLPIWAVCGFGNNGADGIAAARMLFLHGYEVMILLPDAEGRKTPEFEAQLSIAEKLGIPISSLGDFIPGRCGLIIDALFGIGLSRPVEGAYGELLDLMNRQEEAAVVSVDIPSGICSDTGKLLGRAVRADVTVTFGEKKLGQVLFPGRDSCGRLVVADIGFVPEEDSVREAHVKLYGPEDLLRIPRRKRNSHKGTFGKVLVMAGAKNMAGAAYLSALAAYRTGAGLVKVCTPEENRLILQEKLPEAILAAYDTERAEGDALWFQEFLREQTGWADVIVLGPGIGKASYAKRMVETVLSDAYVPIILDADAINLAAENPSLQGYFTENIILTPHILEMARLTGATVEAIQAGPVEAASFLAEKFGVTCVLKDAATVTARRDGRIFVNESGTPAMAKGGMGDVLTGVIAGLAAIGMEDCDAASLGVYVHGLAGEAAERRSGTHSVLAGEVADCIGEVLGYGI